MGPLYKTEGNLIVCMLCPHNCRLRQNQTGICGVRKNSGDKIELTTYGVISGISVDPVEKKPLYHFFPGRNILSIGSYGCNMRCDFCQNWHISQKIPESLIYESKPEQVAMMAQKTENNIGIAFTYNEPVIWFEYLRDVAIAVKESGLHTAIVSNGFVNRDPMNEILKFIDAFNIDLKAFNNIFYKRLTGAEIGPVKASLKQIAGADKHLEITTLIIPGQNDNNKEMKLQAQWIASELGKSVPLHLSRYYPKYRRDDPPTSQEKLNDLFNIASEILDNVYIGNTVSVSGQSTHCPVCGTIVTERSGYVTRLLNIDKTGSCTSCGELVYRHFTYSS